MPTEQHEVYVEKAVAKLRSEGWICGTQYRYDNHVFDIFAYNPRTNNSKVIEVQMSGSPKPDFDSLPFKVEYIFPEKAKTPREIEFAARRMFSALSSATRINIALAIEERPRYYVELSPFITKSKGLVAYHLRKLVRGGLVRRVGGKYEITDLGKNLLVFLRTADSNGLVQAQEWTSQSHESHKSSVPNVSKLKVVNPTRGFDRYTLRQTLLESPPNTFTYKELAEKTEIPITAIGAITYQMGLSHLVRDSTMNRTISENEKVTTVK